MSLKEDDAEFLESNRDSFFSGEEIAEKLGVSRAAVCKAVKSLRLSGCEVEAVTNKGYRIKELIDIITKSGIEKYLKTNNNVYLSVIPTVTSTNTVLREKAHQGAPENTVVVASAQTDGRGRFGRRFVSPEGSGIYMSILLRPDMKAEQAALITTAAAVSVCEAAENLSGRSCGIKWVNDVLADGKKICGILTEASVNVESGTLDYAILGIGVNVYTPKNGFEEEIKDIAGSVFKEKGKDLKNKLTAEIINRFSEYYLNICQKTYLDSYRRHCVVFGKRITVISQNRTESALALGVDNDCRLLVRYDDGREEYLSSGEISTKL